MLCRMFDLHDHGQSHWVIAELLMQDCCCRNLERAQVLQSVDDDADVSIVEIASPSPSASVVYTIKVRTRSGIQRFTVGAVSTT